MAIRLGDSPHHDDLRIGRDRIVASEAPTHADRRRDTKSQTDRHGQGTRQQEQRDS
jgi:hypothetical protein